MKKNILSYLGLGLAVIGTGAFIFLYNYPYQSVNFEKLSNQNKSLSELTLSSSSLTKINKIEDKDDFTTSIDAYVVKTIDEYNEFKEKANLSPEKEFNKNILNGEKLLTISFKGSVITNSKATKLKIDNYSINLTLGVENDFILTGTGNKDEKTYTYYLIPYSTNSEINELNITFKKI